MCSICANTSRQVPIVSVGAVCGFIRSSTSGLASFRGDTLHFCRNQSCKRPAKEVLFGWKRAGSIGKNKERSSSSSKVNEAKKGSATEDVAELEAEAEADSANVP